LIIGDHFDLLIIALSSKISSFLEESWSPTSLLGEMSFVLKEKPKYLKTANYI
jgi:hypothetical protein